MAANLALAGTAIGLSHLLGLLLLLYSLEKVSGVVSRTLKRVTGGKLGRANARDAEAPGASPSPELASSPSKTGHGSGLRAKGWVRGCACPVRGMCEGGLGSEGAGGGGAPELGEREGGSATEERQGGGGGGAACRAPRAPRPPPRRPRRPTTSLCRGRGRPSLGVGRAPRPAPGARAAGPPPLCASTASGRRPCPPPPFFPARHTRGPGARPGSPPFLPPLPPNESPASQPPNEMKKEGRAHGRGPPPPGPGAAAGRHP